MKGICIVKSCNEVIAVKKHKLCGRHVHQYYRTGKILGHRLEPTNKRESFLSVATKETKKLLKKSRRYSKAD